MKPNCIRVSDNLNSFISTIPTEVIQHAILPFLEHPDLKSCRMVCKLWDEFCRNTKTFIRINVQLKFNNENLDFGLPDWKIYKLHLSNNNIDYEYIYQILRNVKRKSDLDCLVLEKRIDFNHVMSDLVLNFPNLKHFSLDSTNLTTHNGLIRIVSQLETLKIRVMNLEKEFLSNLILNFGSNLTKLKIGASFIGNDHLYNLSNCRIARNLKCLEIISRRREKFELQCNFSNFTYLEELTLEFGDTDAQQSLSEISKIENLRILSFSRMNLGDISQLLEKLKRLESLSLHNCTFHSLGEIYKLDGLKKLSIKGGTLDEESINGISRLHLTKLTLDHCGISADFVCRRNSSLTSLRELVLLGVSFSEEAIFTTGKEFTRLECLSISSTPINCETLKSIIRKDNFPSLRNLSLNSCQLDDHHLEILLDSTSLISRLTNLNLDMNNFSENSLQSLQFQNMNGISLSTRTRKNSFTSSTTEHATSPKREKQACLFQ